MSVKELNGLLNVPNIDLSSDNMAPIALTREIFLNAAILRLKDWCARIDSITAWIIK
jgi:hypothetical protein